MTDPFDDSSWSDLAAELGVETPKPVPSLEPPPLPLEVEAEAEPAPADLSETLFAEPLADAEEPGSDTEIIELGGTEEQKRKRRRRRRRRKDGEPAEAEGAEAPEPVDENVTQPSELLKDILKNWDVPGWDDIVSGLYRPHR